MCLDLFYSFLRWEHAISAGECYSRSSGNIWCWSGFFLANLGQDYRRPQRSYFLVWDIPLLNKAFSGFLISDPSPFPKYVAVDQISLSNPELDRVKSVREIQQRIGRILKSSVYFGSIFFIYSWEHFYLWAYCLALDHCVLSIKFWPFIDFLPIKVVSHPFCLRMDLGCFWTFSFTSTLKLVSMLALLNIIIERMILMPLICCWEKSHLMS